MPFGSVANRNIFVATNARLHVPTDVLFSRLAMIRPLTPFDEQLKTKITTPKYVRCTGWCTFAKTVQHTATLLALRSANLDEMLLLSS